MRCSGYLLCLVFLEFLWGSTLLCIRGAIQILFHGISTSFLAQSDASLRFKTNLSCIN
jgi:hypothetical protein